jgi:hypothetical protein
MSKRTTEAPNTKLELVKKTVRSFKIRSGVRTGACVNTCAPSQISSGISSCKPPSCATSKLNCHGSVG